jgi:hypothetical protein
VLNGQLSLHGLDDVEPFVARVIDATLRRRNIALDAHRKEEVLAYAVSELWVASRKYDARRYKSFGQFADGVVARLPRCRRRRRSTGKPSRAKRARP